MNLLQETIRVLNEFGKSLKDIQFVYTHEGCFVPTNGCKRFLDVEYDNGYGDTEIRMDLMLVGKDFWLERHEYDGSEWWEFKQLPKFTKNANRVLSPYDDFARSRYEKKNTNY